MSVIVERRSLLTGLMALVAAPAIVKASSLMQVAPTEIWRPKPYQLMELDRITREAVGLFRNSNAFLVGYADHEAQWFEEFGAVGPKIGDTLRIRLPTDYVVSDGPKLSLQEPSGTEINAIYQGSRRWVSRAEFDSRYAVPEIPDNLALAAAAVAAVPVALSKQVTRRFWSK